MLSLTRDLLRKTRDKNLLEIKPLTVSFWSDFAANPAVMYGLFEQNTQRLVFDPEKVNVVGNDYGICKSVGAFFICLHVCDGLVMHVACMAWSTCYFGSHSDQTSNII
jgi:hypothetical protein